MKKCNKKGEGSFQPYRFADGEIGYRYYKAVNKKKYAVTGRTQKECYEKMDKKLYHLEHPEDKSKMLVIELVNEYLAYKASLKGRLALKEKTLSDYKNQIDTHIKGTRVANIPISELTGVDLMNFFTSLKNKPGRPKSGMKANDPNRPKLSDSYVTKIYNIFTGAYDYAVNIAEYTTRNPTLKIKKEFYDCFKLPKKEVITLSDDQVDTLLKTIEELKYNDIVMYYTLGVPAIVLLYSGIRVSEAAALKWSDYFEADDGRRYFRVEKQRKLIKFYDPTSKKRKSEVMVISSTKTRKNNNIEVTETVISALDILRGFDGLIRGDQYIIKNTLKKPTYGDKISKDINKLYDIAGIRSETVSGAHILRRTFATRWYRAGISVEEIANNIGDEPDTVWRYYIDSKEKNTLNGKMLTVTNKPKNLPKNLR